MKNKKNIVPVAHKRVLSTIEKYKERVKTDKDLYNEDVENFIINVSPLLTKKGTVNKRKIKQFNELVTGFKSQGLDTLKGIRRENKRIKTEKSNKKREQSYIENGLLTNEQDAKNMTKLLQQKITTKLLSKLILDSSQLLDIAEDDDTDVEDIEQVIDYILKTYENVTPNEILEELDEDEDLKIFRDYKTFKEHNSNTEDFKTEEMFKEWLNVHFSEVKKSRNTPLKNIDDFSMMTNKEQEEQYNKFLKGEYNRWL